MVLKLIDATQARPGVVITIDGEPYTVKSCDISKTGKHGAAKCRIDAISILNSGKKKVLAVPGHERFEVPMIEKKRAQVLGITATNATIMDLESFETIEIPYLADIKEQLVPEAQVEYWDIEGRKCVMRVT